MLKVFEIFFIAEAVELDLAESKVGALGAVRILRVIDQVDLECRRSLHKRFKSDKWHDRVDVNTLSMISSHNTSTQHKKNLEREEKTF